MSGPHDNPYQVTHIGSHEGIDHSPPPSKVSLADITDIYNTDNTDTSNIGNGPCGIRPLLTLPSPDDLPPSIDLPPTSAIADEVPWQNPPASYTTPFTRKS